MFYRRYPPLLRMVFQSWWVALIILLAFGIYEQASRTLESDIHFLTQEIHDLEQKIAESSIVHTSLSREVASQNDPAWIELTLIRVLGLVPNGYTKVYLSSEVEENNR